jgi:hypothetical protein
VAAIGIPDRAACALRPPAAQRRNQCTMRPRASYSTRSSSSNLASASNIVTIKAKKGFHRN